MKTADPASRQSASDRVSPAHIDLIANRIRESMNVSCVTAIANDYSYEDVFSRQLEALGRPGDVAIAISTSGNSRNILKAVYAAAARGIHTAGLTGRNGGTLRQAVQHCLCLPSDDTPRIQEGHILVGHILCEIVEAHNCGQTTEHSAPGELLHAGV